jgi:hypothetical protein
MDRCRSPQCPLIAPYVRFSRVRRSDGVHVVVVAGPCHRTCSGGKLDYSKPKRLLDCDAARRRPQSPGRAHRFGSPGAGADFAPPGQLDPGPHPASRGRGDASIGCHAAEAAEVNIDTVRFYERRGVRKSGPRSERSGRRRRSRARPGARRLAWQRAGS